MSSAQEDLIRTLAVALEQEHGPVQLFETHISRVLVAGDLAYKFKKDVRFDFLDFSTLAAREHYCREELRLNRRLAPQLYLDVVPVIDTAAGPRIGGEGPAIEFAVKMRAFEQAALWSHRIPGGLITPGEIDALATRVARFHLDADRAPPRVPWGDAATIIAIAQDTLAAISNLLAEQAGALSSVRQWTAAQHVRLEDVFEQRKALGFIRECHGDLHSRNILTWRDHVEVFDCLEFAERLRWIDIMNDVGFICMDLQYQGRPDLAARLLNLWLEQSGDYYGLEVLRYYQVQRALTRCKVALLRAAQSDGDAAHVQEAQRYLKFARASIDVGKPAIMITHGFSGSGKSTFARRLVEMSGAIQLRSDVERKRLFPAGSACDLYADAATRNTYLHLRTLARHVVQAGWPVVVDATFLRSEQRDMFASLASETAVPFCIIDIRASVGAMKARIEKRMRDRNDASEADVAVLEQQMANCEPLSAWEEERAHVVDLENGVESAAQALLKQLE